MTLSELATHFKSDKWGAHRYTEHYDRHFRQLRSEKITVLEIGIGGYKGVGAGGASLRMWKRYFPNAQIVGLDIEDKSFCDEPRIKTFRGSQADQAVLQGILDECGEVNIVIDDGSHRPEHIRETFAYLFPRIADDAIYAIEDTQTSYWPLWGGSNDLQDPSTTISLVKDLVDGLHHEEFVDPTYRSTYSDTHLRSLHVYHNLVILEKGPNTEGSGTRSKKRELEVAIEADAFVPSAARSRAPFSVPIVAPGVAASD